MAIQTQTKQRIRLGIITSTYFPNLNGVAISLKMLVEELKTHGIEVFVVAPNIKNFTYPEYVKSISSFPIPKRIDADMKIPYNFTHAALVYFKKKNINILHSNDPLSGFTGITIAKKLNIPHVHTYHTHWELYKFNKYTKYFGYKKIIRVIINRLCNQVEVVIAPTTKIESYLKEIGVKTKIQTIINIPNIKHLYKSKKDSELMQRFNIKQNDFVFITFGRVSSEKSIDKSIKYLSPLLTQYSNIKYVISGAGSAIKQLKDYAVKLGVGDKICFTGKYMPDELNRLASLGDVFLFTSNFDTQALTLLEAASTGLPIISIKDDCVDYILKDGENGFICDEKDLTKMCKKLYLNKKLQNKFSKSSLSKSKKLSEQKITQEYIKLYYKYLNLHDH